MIKDYLYSLATDTRTGFIARVCKAFLFFASLIYGLAVRFLIFLNRLKPYTLPCKVVSVGNITLGGTGKTSLVEFIARYLQQKGKRVAILTRGYKRTGCARPAKACEARNAGYESMGDEPYMLKINLTDVPVVVSAHRIKAGNRALAEYRADTVLLDDGFQQWRLKKDLEIVTIDAACAFGNRLMIPRGVLREPLASLKRADVFVLTNAGLKSHTRGVKDFLAKSNHRALIVEALHYPCGFYHATEDSSRLINPGDLKGKTAAVFSGIGNPGSFEHSLQELGIRIGILRRFPDHYRYRESDIENIMQQAKRHHVDTVITTQKDAVRLFSLGLRRYPLPILVLRVELKITENEQEFCDRLLGVYSS